VTARWYALRAKSRKEELLWRHAVTRGFDVYFPRLRVNPVNPRSRNLRPYFPGYMFVKTDLRAIGTSTFLWMPYGLGLVSFGGEAAAVPDALIFELQRRLREVNAAGGEVFDGLKKGEQIRIHQGPFSGYEAIFDARVRGSERVRVLLELLNGARLPVELPSGHIERLARA
jgi:transcription antitermination factor NusG